MVRFTYNDNGRQVVDEFERYTDFIRFVIFNRTKDEDFISLQMVDEEGNVVEDIQGLDGLCNRAMENCDKIDEAEAIMASIMTETIDTEEE